MTLSQKLATLSNLVHDAMQQATASIAPSASAALITAFNRAPLIIGEIAESAGLTHSATVRLVDRLEREGLLRRQQRQGRTVLVDITPRGRKRALELIAARVEAVDAFVAVLRDDEKIALEGYLHRILRHQLESPLAAKRFGRYCDLDNCEVVSVEGVLPGGDGHADVPQTSPGELTEAAKV